MIKPKSWTKKARYHVIDQHGQDLGNYATQKTALSRAAEYDILALNNVVGIYAPHSVVLQTTNKGEYDRLDIIKSLYNN